MTPNIVIFWIYQALFYLTVTEFLPPLFKALPLDNHMAHAHVIHSYDTLLVKTFLTSLLSGATSLPIAFCGFIHRYFFMEFIKT